MNTIQKSILLLLCSTTYTISIAQIAFESDHFTDNKVSNLSKYLNENKESQTTLSEKEKLKTRTHLNLSFTVGVTHSTLDIYELPFEVHHDFGNLISLRSGMALECMLPFNKNKWSLTIEPSFQYFCKKKEFSSSTPVSPPYYSIDYQSIEFPLYLRYYAFLNPENKIFFSGGACKDVPINSYLGNHSRNKFWATTNINYLLGLAYIYQDKYYIMLRYWTPRNIMNHDNDYWDSEYKAYSLILGYHLNNPRY